MPEARKSERRSSGKTIAGSVTPQDYIQVSIQFWESYHHHKEQMAYVATALSLTGAVTFTFLDLSNHLSGRPLAWVMLLSVVTLTVIGALIFIYWQLRLRHLAAGMLRACHKLIVLWLTAPPTEDDLQLEISPTGRPLGKALWATYKEVRKTYNWFESPIFISIIAMLLAMIWGLAAILHVFTSGFRLAIFWWWFT